MHLDISFGNPFASACDLLVVYVFQDEKRPLESFAALDVLLDGDFSAWMKTKQFTGSIGRHLSFPTFGRIKAKEVAVVGLGLRSQFSLDVLRRVAGSVVKLARDRKAISIFTTLPFEEDVRSAAQAFTEGAVLASYRFHAYKGRLNEKKTKDSEAFPSRLTLWHARRGELKRIEEGISFGRILSEATHLTRDLVNTPSSDMTPSRLAEVAKSIAVRGSGIDCRELDQKSMEQMGMHAVLAVAKGSMHSPVGVHLTYRSPDAKRTVVLVGKAVTFDSGGLSLKPADAMITMKCDMAGAATVIGVFQALAILKPNVNVHGVFFAVENMPSGTAYRPGDVVKTMDGTTIEILNTDAEGRVTLADALLYGAKQKPDVMIDLATLTGACVTALGDDIAAIMTNNATLGQKLLSVARDAGEPLWELPLHESYQELIKSKIADLKNVAGRPAGAITAGLFLKPFVGEIPWAHLDIAGPAYIEKETRPDLPYGATGYGVRTIIRYLMQMGK